MQTRQAVQTIELANCTLVKNCTVDVIVTLLTVSNALGGQYEIDHGDIQAMCNIGPVFLATNMETTMLMFMDKNANGNNTRSIIFNQDQVFTTYVDVLGYFPCLADVEELKLILSPKYSFED